MPSVAISSANKEIKDLVVQNSDVPDGKLTNGPVKHPRGQYLSYIEEEKAQVTKRAAEFGITITLRYFNKAFADRQLKKSMVKTWAINYKKGIVEQVKLGESLKIEKLKTKKRSHPSLTCQTFCRAEGTSSNCCQRIVTHAGMLA